MKIKSLRGVTDKPLESSEAPTNKPTFTVGFGPRQGELPGDGGDGAGSGTVRLARAPAAIQAAVEEAVAGDQPLDAIATLEGFADDERQPLADRVKAALALGNLAADVFRSTDKAEAALAKAKSLSLDAVADPRAKLLEARLLIAKQDPQGALAILSELEPTPEVSVLRADALRRSGEPKEAEGVAAMALETATTHRSELLFQQAYGAFVAWEPHKARQLAKESFAERPNRQAAQLLRNLVLPKFDAETRPLIESRLKSAHQAYQKGDFAEVRRLALDVLRFDDNEALGYHLYAVAALRSTEDRPISADLDTPEKRRALIDRTNEAFAKAGATPDRLFVEWNDLTELQQATIGRSVIAYAEILPDVLAKKPRRRYHLVSPSQSCVDFDPNTDRTDANSTGVTWYGTRGWVAGPTIVTGLEDVDAAAHGSYDTVAHELSHVVQDMLERKPYEAWPEPIRAFVASEIPNPPKDFGAIVRMLHARASSGVAQPITFYAASMPEEYFAESMMSFLNPTEFVENNKARLEERDPLMFRFAEAIVRGLSG